MDRFPWSVSCVYILSWLRGYYLDADLIESVRIVLECMRRFDPSQYSHYLSTYNTHWLYQHHSIDGEEHIGLVCVYKCVCVEREGGEKEGRGSFAGFKWAWNRSRETGSNARPRFLQLTPITSVLYTKQHRAHYYYNLILKCVMLFTSTII